MDGMNGQTQGESNTSTAWGVLMMILSHVRVVVDWGEMNISF